MNRFVDSPGEAIGRLCSESAFLRTLSTARIVLSLLTVSILGLSCSNLTAALALGLSQDNEAINITTDRNESEDNPDQEDNPEQPQNRQKQQKHRVKDSRISDLRPSQRKPL